MYGFQPGRPLLQVMSAEAALRSHGWAPGAGSGRWSGRELQLGYHSISSCKPLHGGPEERAAEAPGPRERLEQPPGTACWWGSCWACPLLGPPPWWGPRACAHVQSTPSCLPHRAALEPEIAGTAFWFRNLRSQRFFCPL